MGYRLAMDFCTKEIMNAFPEISNYCRELLLNFPEAKETLYYANNRISISCQEKFSFGYFPSFKHLQILISSIGEKSLVENKLLYPTNSQHKERHSPMENHNLVMPYRDVYGNIVALVGRAIFDFKPKYKNTIFQKGNHLFGLYEAKKSIIKNKSVFVVEGQFDCISAYNKGIENIVALGSSNMTFEQFALLTRYTNNITLLLDNDDAGKIGADKIVRSFGKYANIKNMALPDNYKDIDEFLNECSVDDLEFVLMGK